MTLSTLDRYDGTQVSQRGRRAVVLGGGMAGLCAARVLVDAYDEVLLFERDSPAATGGPRRSVPQGNHFHVLTEAGRSSIEDLFPGYSDHLVREGGLMIDAGSNWAFYMQGDFLADPPGRYPMYCASRPLYEQVLRDQAESYSDIAIYYDARATDLVFSADSSAVQGVRILTSGTGSELVEADVVVDTTGRRSQTPTWLADAGYDTPHVDEVTIDLVYASGWLDRPPGVRNAVSVIPSPPDTRGGAVLPIEDDRYIMTLWGMHDQTPPGEWSEWREFAEALPIPDFAELLTRYGGDPSDVTLYPFPSNIRRRYEDLDRLPHGLVVAGDSLASFNPIYAQGMSVAVLDSLALHHALRTAEPGFLTSEYFSLVTDIIDIAWLLAVTSDFQYAETTGPKPTGTTMFNWLRNQVVSSAQSNGSVADVLFRVLNMERHPGALLHPSVLGRVFSPFA
jgi:2-polyprenyl-6-methoxyphenol hydroxylase-like FAD-dependent oxidoreductase